MFKNTVISYCQNKKCDSYNNKWLYNCKKCYGLFNEDENFECYISDINYRFADIDYEFKLLYFNINLNYE